VTQSRDEVASSLRAFKKHRDNLMHEDISTFDHYYERFLDFCNKDPLVQTVLAPLEGRITPDADAWWNSATSHEGKLLFPANPDEEFFLRYRILQSVESNPRRVFNLGFAHGKRKLDEAIELFRTLVIRDFADELSNRLSEAANLATPAARLVQAVPLNRIPSSGEVKIFLSHKSVDKPLVQRYYGALKTVGLDPWLDESNMAAGANLERELLRGFEESCAAVFFITESFKDENYLAAEIDYAIGQKRKKAKKFALITLRYANAAPVPGLLTPYIYKDVGNDLEGFNQLVKALPIEFGPIRWRVDVV
jgi:hypothetical protein